jgi:electron transfer flavoprotein beta subunit
MDMPSISIIKKLTIDANTATVEREIEGGKEVITVDFPFLATVAEGVAEPKIPNMRGIMSARTKPLQVVEPIAVASLSNITSFEMPAARSAVKLIATDNVSALIDALHSEAKVI